MIRDDDIPALVYVACDGCQRRLTVELKGTDDPVEVAAEMVKDAGWERYPPRPGSEMYRHLCQVCQYNRGGHSRWVRGFGITMGNG